jgi:hypothetical protein
MIIRDTLFGDEAQTIADVAQDAEASLIVIASRGRGPFMGAVLGSTTQRLLLTLLVDRAPNAANRITRRRAASAGAARRRGVVDDGRGAPDDPVGGDHSPARTSRR